MFSCIALRESKVFHLRKVISAKLALRLWTITDANLVTLSMLCGLDRVTVHISGWEKIISDAFPEAKLHAMRPLFLFTNYIPCLSPVLPNKGHFSSFLCLQPEF